MNNDKISNAVSQKILNAYLFPHKNLKGYFTDKQLNHLVNARAKYGQFTVLSGIVYWIDDAIDDMKLLCLTTGVKCVPDIKLKVANGNVIHDMHAEVLAIRSLSYYILDQISEVNSGDSSSFLSKVDNNKYQINENIKIAFYVSELPCGDCSLDDFIDRNPSPWEKNTEINFYRGRSSYTEVGVVRTKPGRKDSPASLSKSCSDKLALMSIKGILKGIVADLIVNNNFNFNYIVFPQNQIEKNQLSIKRCFDKRIDITNLKGFKKFNIIKASNEVINEFTSILVEKRLGQIEIDKEKNLTACELSIVCIPGSKIIDIVNSGIKNGKNYGKAVQGIDGASILSRRSMLKKRNNIAPISTKFETYYDWKKREDILGYNRMVDLSKQSIGNWGYSSFDNFNLDFIT